MSGLLIDKINSSIEGESKKYDLVNIDYFSDETLNENKIDKLAVNLKKILSKNSTVWITTLNFDNKKSYIPFILQNIFANNNFFIKNLIVWVTNTGRSNTNFNNYYKKIIFFSLNDKEYIFNKDLIREKHIWKNVEWGKRKFRYNPKGKDPSNFWLPTEDDGKAKITKHLILSHEEKNDRIFNLCSNYKSKSLLISNKEYHHKNLTKQIIIGIQVENQ